jgi:hypothetical protein
VKRGAAETMDVVTLREHLHTLGVDLQVDAAHTLVGEAPPVGDAALATLHGYEVRRTLGQGGMGAVHLAWQRSLDREVAVKMLHGNADPRARAGLVHEGLVTGSLEHPNIVPIHDIGLSPSDQPLFVMKRIEGNPWSDWLGQPSKPQLDVMTEVGGPLLFHLGILSQVCNAVAYAHSRSTIHRDLKPANVMIGPFGEVYVVDWGIALRLPAARSEQLVGTPAYMAPEMARREPVDERADVFSLGAILYEVVTGSPLRTGEVAEVLANAAAGAVPELPPGVPAALRSLCRDALAPTRELRTASAVAFQRDLADFLRRRPVLALADAARARVTEVVARLAANGPDRDLHALSAEARFAYGQVSRLEPELAADLGYDAMILALLDRAMSGEQVALAEQLLVELGPRATESQRSAVAAMAGVLADRAAELAERRRQASMAFGAGERRRATLAMMTLNLSFALIAALWEASGRVVVFEPLALGYIAITLGALANLVRVRELPRDSLSWGTHAAAAISVFGNSSVMIVAWAWGATVHATFSIMMVGGGPYLALQAVYANRRLGPAAVVFVLLGLSVMVVPPAVYWWWIFATLGIPYGLLYWADVGLEEPA